MSRTRKDGAMTDKELDIRDSDLGLDSEGFLDEDDEDIEADRQEELERLERESLQRPDPADDDLPDRAFDRIVPGV